MKKLLSLALCCVIAASSLASCAQSAAKNYSPKITVSSSEAEESALYLTNRPQADSEKTKTFKRKIHPLKRGEIRKQAKTLISSRFKDSGQTGYK